MSSTSETQSTSSSAERAGPCLQKQRIVTLSRAGRFLDAHVVPSPVGPPDFNVVTRPPQVNNTQRWLLTNLSSTSSSGPYRIQQVSTGRYLDGLSDFRVVTRPKENNDTQHWFIEDFGGTVRIRHRSITGRILQPHFAGVTDFQVFTETVLDQDQELVMITAELLVE